MGRRAWVQGTFLRTVLLLAGVGVAYCVAFVVPSAPWTSRYVSVAADLQRWSSAESDNELLRTDGWFSLTEHQVVDGKLFLRVQSTQHALFLVTYVDTADWDAAKVARYRAEHPELDALWPQPSARDGGVRWLRR